MQIESALSDRKDAIRRVRSQLASIRRLESERKRAAATPKGKAVQANKAERAARIAEAPKMRAAGLTYEEMGLAWGVSAATAKAYHVKAERILRYQLSVTA